MNLPLCDDLREYIDQARAINELKVIEGADWDVEMGAITELYLSHPAPPMLLFDNIKGYKSGYRVISNVASTPKRTALGLGLPTEANGVDLVKAWREKAGGIRLIPPVEVKTGPVKENVHTGGDINIFEFPVPKWHEHDGGRYIGTGCMVIQRDPDEGWVNFGAYRVQAHDRDVATVYISPGRHGDIIKSKYWQRGLPCPVAVSVGQEPLLFSAAFTPIPWGVSEYDYAGGIKGKPIEVIKGEVTGLPIPANAEIVLEGELVPPGGETRAEGPYAEWPGYYASGARDQPIFKVKTVLHRNQPIIMGRTSFAADAFDQNMCRAATLWEELDRQVPNVKGVWNYVGRVPQYILAISIKQSYGGHARQAALAAAGSHVTGYFTKYIIVVDDDIDPANTDEVLWALATRSDPATSIDIVRDCWGSLLDPVLPPERRDRGELTNSKALITACKPFHWMKQFPAEIRGNTELLEKVNKKWRIVGQV